MYQKISFKNIDEVNKFYDNLGIKTYWTKNLNDFETIAKITEMFNLLHSLYPSIIIKEMGYGNLFFPQYVKLLTANIKGELAKKLRLKLFNTVLEKEYNNSSAIYNRGTNGIYFNYMIKTNVEATLIHEFGHAIIHKYNLDKDFSLCRIFNSASKEFIKNTISKQATMNISEFIAECFLYSLLIPNKHPFISTVSNKINMITGECEFLKDFKCLRQNNNEKYTTTRK